MLNQNPQSDLNDRLVNIIREIELLKRDLRLQSLQRISNDVHDPITLSSDANAVLSLSVQEIGLDVQAANTIFSGPASGANASPTFRALVQSDLPLTDGWMSAGRNWKYASATTFTTNGDVRSEYPVGTKIMLTQTTVKYFYVIGATYSAPNTTVTVTGGSDYSLVNNDISSNYVSYVTTPRGFPGWFNWSPSFTGYSANPSGGIYRFKIEGRMVTAVIREPNTGTSNAGSLTITAPVTAATITNMTWLTTAALSNNSVTLTTWGRGRIGTGESSFTFGTDPSIDGGFTSSNGKRVAAFQINYEI